MHVIVFVCTRRSRMLVLQMIYLIFFPQKTKKLIFYVLLY